MTNVMLPTTHPTNAKAIALKTITDKTATHTAYQAYQATPNAKFVQKYNHQEGNVTYAMDTALVVMTVSVNVMMVSLRLGMVINVF